MMFFMTNRVSGCCYIVQVINPKKKQLFAAKSVMLKPSPVFNLLIPIERRQNTFK